ncbi:hypothetical protein ACFQX7_33710 [Luedemannella flava]
MRRHGLTADGHVELSQYGVRKRRHADYDEADVDRLLPLVTEAAAALTPRGARDPDAAQVPASDDRAGLAVDEEDGRGRVPARVGALESEAGRAAAGGDLLT